MTSDAVTSAGTDRQALLARLLTSSTPVPAARADGPRHVPITGPVPASGAQEALWFVEQLDESPRYNMTMTLRLDGRPDIGALRTCVQALVERHPALRTSFTVIDGHLHQMVHDHVTLPWTCADADTEDLGFVTAHALRPFDLESGPLVRAGLWRFPDSSHVLSLVVHHMRGRRPVVRHPPERDRAALHLSDGTDRQRSGGTCTDVHRFQSRSARAIVLRAGSAPTTMVAGSPHPDPLRHHSTTRHRNHRSPRDRGIACRDVGPAFRHRGSRRTIRAFCAHDPVHGGHGGITGAAVPLRQSRPGHRRHRGGRARWAGLRTRGRILRQHRARAPRHRPGQLVHRPRRSHGPHPHRCAPPLRPAFRVGRRCGGPDPRRSSHAPVQCVLRTPGRARLIAIR
ncbi:condensation domain-containing protein [Rhodococcus sp. SMB37]|nr:condensation domain-containing protein [Rhodococcus sp. SMB37]